MNEIVEMIYQWHQGTGFKGIRRSLGFDRNTIRKYIRLAQAAGVQRGSPFPEEGELVNRLKELPAPALLRQTPGQDQIAPYRQWVQGLLTETEPKSEEITAKQIWRLFREKTGLLIGYCTMKRYLRSQFQFGAPLVTVRLEVAPGSQAQVDFGSAGKMVDPTTGQPRRAWAFIMTLSYSRHRFVRFVFRQDVDTWIDCHIRAFEYFQGVAATVVLDNLKSGVIKPDIYDPVLNRAYGELERHYDFVADPAKVGLARHKGKVERSVPVVRQQLLAGRSFKDIDEANERALKWCREEIGMEIHGTTKRRPWEVFQKEEAAHLKPLPAEAFERPLWKNCTVHPDHHIVFDRSYYSLPTRFIGQKVWVRGDRQLVRIFLDEQLIKTHERAVRPGTWRTDLSDYPPEKLAYLMPAPTHCRSKAAQIGPQTESLMREILSDHAMRNLRKAQAILRLAEKYGPAAMEAAAQRALEFGNFQYRSLKTILEKGWLRTENPSPISTPLSPLGQRFLRPPEYFAGHKEVAP
jgi:transposase